MKKLHILFRHCEPREARRSNPAWIATALSRLARTRFSFCLGVLPAVLLLTACVPALLTGGTQGAVVAAQERTPGRALDDATIFLKIKEKFAEAPTSDMFVNVEVKVMEARVLLTGNVDKPESQIDAVNAAWQVDGVKEVINEIQISDKSGFVNYAKDVWISTAVRTKLLITKHIRSVNYSVITVNQVVYLMGVAQDQEELDRATYVAGTVQYVQKVVSYVRLKDDPRRP